jgi:hypothetical protein
MLSRLCTFLGNISIQLYYPFEKIAWAADEKILPFKSDKWWYLSIGAWGIYIVLFIIR